MQSLTKKRPTDVARFVGSARKLRELRRYAATLGLTESQNSIPWREAFPEFIGNEVETMLSGYRHREGLTQVELSRATGIPQRHISEMENGKRIIGKESARKLGAALNCDYRTLL